MSGWREGGRKFQTMGQQHRRKNFGRLQSQSGEYQRSEVAEKQLHSSGADADRERVKTCYFLQMSSMHDHFTARQQSWAIIYTQCYQ